MSQHTEKFQNFERILTVDSKISINKTFGPNSGAVFPVWTQKYVTNPFVPNAPFLYPLKTSENRRERMYRERMGQSIRIFIFVYLRCPIIIQNSR